MINTLKNFIEQLVFFTNYTIAAQLNFKLLYLY